MTHGSVSESHPKRSRAPCHGRFESESHRKRERSSTSISIHQDLRSHLRTVPVLRSSDLDTTGRSETGEFRASRPVRDSQRVPQAAWPGSTSAVRAPICSGSHPDRWLREHSHAIVHRGQLPPAGAIRTDPMAASPQIAALVVRQTQTHSDCNGLPRARSGSRSGIPPDAAHGPPERRMTPGNPASAPATPAPVAVPAAVRQTPVVRSQRTPAGPDGCRGPQAPPSRPASAIRRSESVAPARASSNGRALELSTILWLKPTRSRSSSVSTGFVRSSSRHARRAQAAGGDT